MGADNELGVNMCPFVSHVKLERIVNMHMKIQFFVHVYSTYLIISLHICALSICRGLRRLHVFYCRCPFAVDTVWWCFKERVAVPGAASVSQQLRFLSGVTWSQADVAGRFQVISPDMNRYDNKIVT